MNSPHHPSFHLVPQDMRDSIATFDAEAKQIVEAFATSLESSYNPPEVVYHYTNDAGLHGILQSGRIWLTDVFSLNDPSELRHSLERAQAILKHKAASGPPESKIFAKDFALLDKALHRIAYYFVCSFSEAKDDLGQWRAYADNGRGYALGFDSKALEEAFAGTKTTSSENAAFPVIYNDSILDGIHLQLIEKMFGLISRPSGRRLSGDVIVAYMTALLATLASHVLHAGLFFKHEAYSNEREYRFLEVHRIEPIPAHDLRTRPYSLIRYRELDWKGDTPAALKKIVIGPAADAEKARRFAEDCLREFSNEKAEIVSSDIPYRAY